MDSMRKTECSILKDCYSNNFKEYVSSVMRNIARLLLPTPAPTEIGIAYKLKHLLSYLSVAYTGELPNEDPLPL